MRVFAYAGLLFLALTASVSASESSWSFLPLPGNSADLTSLAPRWGEDGQGLIAASQSEIFIRSEKGLWETLSRTHPASISDLKCFEELPAMTWVLTERGARVLESGRPDREIFPVSDSGASVQAWAVFPGEPARWFAGTSQGVFESRDQGKSWKALPLRTAEPVIGLHFVFQRLWIVTSGRVYSTKDLKSFRESFSLSASSREDGIIEMTPTPPEETADEELLAPILDSSSSAEPFQGLGIATRFGVFTLDPESGFWSRLPSRGLTGSAVTHLRFSSADGRVWAGTGDGIFGYDPSKRLWEKPSQTPSLGAITALEVMASSGAVAAASRRGVLLFVPGLLQNTPLKEPIAAEGLDLLKRIELYEPSVREVQRAAVRASNSGRWKTRRWHGQSRLSALLPSLSFGRNFDWDNNIDIDRGGTNDPDRYITGPDQQSRGWDADVSWDLGDFIWSSSQTSIDSRDKINAEFRNSVLSEVTRLFYERRRLQFEIALTSWQNTRALLEKKIHLEETTALIDALTDGYLSRKAERALRDHPELGVLYMPSRFS